MNILSWHIVSGLTKSINKSVQVSLHGYERSKPLILGLSTLALALFLALTWGSPAQAEGFNVDSLVTFVPLSSTYRTITNTTGCPAGFVGKFTFTARLRNKSSSPAMPGLDVFVQTLTNGNVLLDPQTNVRLGGAGAVMEIPQAGQYADGLLSANEVVDVPFVVCLKTRQSFQFFVDVFGIVTKLVSINQAGTNGSGGLNGGAGEYTISANGRFVAFTTFASDLVTNDTNGQQDVFIRDLQTGTTTLVSVNRLGTDSGNDNSGSPAISADGRFVAFSSSATDLVATNVTGGRGPNVFVRDLQTGTTTLASVNRNGTDGGNGGSELPSLSADGRFVAFLSDASDLVADDTNGQQDVFIRDLQTGTTVLASVNRAGANGGNGRSGTPLLSADGRFVAFASLASDLVVNDTNGTWDIFMRDLQMGTTALVSVNQAGTDSGNGRSGNVPVGADFALSPDGRYVAFFSAASDLVATDTNGADDVFIRDLQTGTTALVSVNRAGTNSGNGASFDPVLSSDGRYVAFFSTASDLMATDTNGTGDVFIRDLQTGTTALVSVNAAGTNSGSGVSFDPALSADGRFVAFSSQANDLVATDTNGGQPTRDSQIDVFVRDLQKGTTTLASVNRAGTDSGNDSSEFAVLSADGRFVVFPSAASDLVATDTNGTSDLFVRPVQ